ncbi:MAG TPA: DoxX family protein [Ktedonobacteraceae bacterium]|jgi:putative oxidoreductase|nr:DoxX family protein [Ktedonobacteraceae bacterium]
MCMGISLSLGLLLLRLVAGLTIAAHGAQKLFGWFGGPGFAGTMKMQERMGFKPHALWASFVILGEFGGGLSLALGFLTPLGAAGIFGAMFMAIAKSHWKNGFWNSKRGFEFPLQLLGAAVAIGLAGPGSYSLDALFGIALPAPLLFLILALVALLVDFVGLAMGRAATPAAAPASPPTTTPGEPRPSAS